MKKKGNNIRPDIFDVGINIEPPKNPRLPEPIDDFTRDQLMFIKCQIANKESFISYALSHKELFQDKHFQNFIRTVVGFYDTTAYKTNELNIRDYYNMVYPIHEYIEAENLWLLEAYRPLPFYTHKFIAEWPTTVLSPGVPKINRGEYVTLLGDDTTKYEDIIDNIRDVTTENFECGNYVSTCPTQVKRDYVGHDVFFPGCWDNDVSQLKGRHREYCKWQDGLASSLERKTEVYRELILEFIAQKQARRGGVSLFEFLSIFDVHFVFYFSSLIVILPFFAFMVTGLFTRQIGLRSSIVVPVISIGISFLCSLYLFIDFAMSSVAFLFELGCWFAVSILTLHWGFWFDSLTFVMLLVVLGISFLVHIYSIEYMHADPHLPRFMAYLSLFTFFMLILVTAHNFVQMFIGWEGVGLSSFLLINFWFTRPEANAAALKAVLINRIGDVFITLAFLILFSLAKTMDYGADFAILPYFSVSHTLLVNTEINLLFLFAVSVLIGGMAKSAQLPSFSWLLNAMEGPTPVSALIHAATMVTAGVFILARCSFLLEILQYNTFHYLVILTGALTAFFGSLGGLAQFDIKKIIAFSTCSQLGYMFLVIGLSQYSLAIFHLANHAIFKALLFLSAGVIIHAFKDEQDMRKLYNAIKHLPFTYLVLVVASLALMGFPYLTGFYSKDFILEIAAFEYYLPTVLAFMLASITASFTAYYSMRLIYFVFWRSHKKLDKSFNNDVIFYIFRYKFFEIYSKPTIKEPGYFMTFPLIVLGIGSIFFGYLLNDLFIGAGTTFWNDSLSFAFGLVGLYELEFTQDFFTLLPLLFSFSGAGVAFYFFELNPTNLASAENKAIVKGYEFMSRKWFLEAFYNFFFAITILRVGYIMTFMSLDRGFLAYFGPKQINIFVRQLNKFLTSLQSGFIFHYITMIFLGITLFLTHISLYFMRIKYAVLLGLIIKFVELPIFDYLSIPPGYGVAYYKDKDARKYILNKHICLEHLSII